MKNNKLRVYYSDKVPIDKMLYVYVKSLDKAMLIIDVLIKRDLKDNRITDNLIGLEIFKKDEKVKWSSWENWENEEGDDIDVVMENYKSKVKII